jgi:hypothetical protein
MIVQREALIDRLIDQDIEHIRAALFHSLGSRLRFAVTGPKPTRL